MNASLQIAITADLHWGHRHGMDETRQLIAHLYEEPPDVLILAGDIGHAILFGDCLAQFSELDCQKLLVPGNHDIWVEAESERDSLQRYQEDLLGISKDYGFHYLDAQPWLMPEVNLGIVGTINWYDYSWSEGKLQEMYPDEIERLQTMRFSRGRHNDVNFVRWPLDNRQFTTMIVDTFEQQLEQTLSQVDRVMVVAHHPPFYGLNFPRSEPPTSMDGLLWDAFAGNTRMEEILKRHADRIDYVFCGHTHRERENRLGHIRGFNIGSDYPFKRLIRLHWPEGTIEMRQFGEK